MKTCPKCKGCGKLDAKEGKPWVDVTTPKPNPEVRAGRLLPKDCDQCQAAGTIEGDDAAEVPGNPAPAPAVKATPPASEKPAKSK